LPVKRRGSLAPIAVIKAFYANVAFFLLVLSGDYANLCLGAKFWK
jgi:hypothetical protein